jgi:hypothetical protein
MGGLPWLSGGVAGSGGLSWVIAGAGTSGIGGPSGFLGGVIPAGGVGGKESGTAGLPWSAGCLAGGCSPGLSPIPALLKATLMGLGAGFLSPGPERLSCGFSGGFSETLLLPSDTSPGGSCGRSLTATTAPTRLRKTHETAIPALVSRDRLLSLSINFFMFRASSHSETF